MAAPRVTVHYGPPSWRSKQHLVQDVLAGSTPPDFGFLYLTSNSARARQLQDTLIGMFRQSFEPPFLSLPGLLYRLAALAKVRFRILDESEKLAVLSNVLKGTLQAVPLGRLQGGLSYLSRYVAFIKALNIRDEAVLRLRYQKLSGKISSVDESLIRVFSDYQRFLEGNNLEDRQGVYCHICDEIVTGSFDFQEAFPGVRRMVLENVRPGSPIERTLLKLVTAELETLEVSIDTLPGEEPESLWKWLEFLPVDESGVIWTARLESPGPERRLHVFPNRMSEVQWVAHEITRLQRAGGRPAGGIAVSAANLKDYEALVEQVFSQFGIPYFITSGRRSRQSRLLSCLAAFLETVRGNYPRTALFNFLHRLDPQQLPVEPLVLRQLEDLATFLGLEDGLESWTERLTDNLERPDRLPPDLVPEEDRPGLSVAAVRLADVLTTLAPDTRRTLPLTVWWQTLVASLRPFLPQTADLDLLSVRQENLLVSTFLDQLSQRGTLPGQELLRFDEFTQSVLEQMDHAVVQTDVWDDAVAVGCPVDLAPAQFREIFWLGLTERAFPSRDTRQVLFDEAQSSNWGFLSWQDRLLEEYRLFYSWSSSATKRITYLAPRKAGEAPVRLSPLLDKIGLAEPEGLEPAWIASTVDGSYAPSNIRRGVAVQRLRESGAFSAYTGLLANPQTRQLLRHRLFPKGISVSPSRLERYFQCGYRFFLESVLRLKKPVRSQLEMAPIELGNLIHRVLYRFFQEHCEAPDLLPESSRPVWVERHKRIMHEILQEEWATIGRDLSWHQQAFLQDQRHKIAGGLLESTAAGLLSQFVEVQWEWLHQYRLHSLEIEIPPTVIGQIPEGSGKEAWIDVSLKGKIDRIDHGPKGPVIIDYKTGLSSLGRAAQGWGFQLPLYLHLAQTQKEERPAAAFFCVVSPPSDIRIKPLLPGQEDLVDDLDQLVRYYLLKSITVAEQLYTGRFPTTLLKESAAGCSSCDFRKICRYSPVLAERLRESRTFPCEENVIQKGSWVGPPDRTPFDGASSVL